MRTLLEQIAYITDGAYIRSGGSEFGLDYLYDRQLIKLKNMMRRKNIPSI